VTNLSITNNGSASTTLTLRTTSPYATTVSGTELTGSVAAKNSLTTITPRLSGDGFTAASGALTRSITVAAGQTVDPRLTNRFLYDQDVYATYVTYERPFGDFTVLGGLRAEQVEIRTNQLTSAQKDDNSYFHVYPSLHLGYTLSQTQTLTANYSKRVQRPQSQDLNPYPIYQDPKNFFAGNPDLKPQITDSYELGYQYRKGPASYLATLYYRESRDGVTNVVRNLGDGVFLTTREEYQPHYVDDRKYFELDTLYTEFATPWQRRRLPMRYEPRDDAVDVYRQWQDRNGGDRRVAGAPRSG
jgi:outer membrane receptor protein involved in Fe transport